MLKSEQGGIQKFRGFFKMLIKDTMGITKTSLENSSDPPEVRPYEILLLYNI